MYFKFNGFRLFREMALISLTWGIFMLLYFEIFRKGKIRTNDNGDDERVEEISIEMDQN